MNKTDFYGRKHANSNKKPEEINSVQPFISMINFLECQVKIDQGTAQQLRYIAQTMSKALQSRWWGRGTARRNLDACVINLTEIAKRIQEKSERDHKCTEALKND